MTARGFPLSGRLRASVGDVREWARLAESGLSLSRIERQKQAYYDNSGRQNAIRKADGEGYARLGLPTGAICPRI
jgi:hypothetical protein